MRIIGITGGVGAGKSTVLSYMQKEYGAVICEADKAAHILEEPGQKCYRKIVEYFGKDVLKETGEIDRKKLGEIVFSDPGKLHVLNAIVHPAVKEYIREEIEKEKEKGTGLFLVEAALLIEEHYDEICDELWYVYADPEVRKKRLRESRGYSEERIDGIMKNQKSDEEFRKHCAKILNNSGSMEETCTLIEKALKS